MAYFDTKSGSLEEAIRQAVGGQKIEENGWYDDGSKKNYRRFKGGVEDGESIRWYRNGNKWKVTN